MKKAFWLLLTVSLLTGSITLFSKERSLGLIAPWVESTSDVSYPEEGELVYDHDDEKLYVKKSSSWVDITSGALPNMSGNAGKVLAANSSETTSEWVEKQDVVQIAYLKDVKTVGTAGGTATYGSWVTRTLSNSYGDTSIVSLSSSQFTLQAGKYHIYATVPAWKVDSHMAKLYNVSDSADQIFGSTARSESGGYGSMSHSIIDGMVEITAAKTFSIEHKVQTTKSGDGYGVASNFGSETYTQVRITKVE